MAAEDLRERALKGDEDIVEDLFREFQHDLRRFLRARCGSNIDADDALQDTFESAVKSLSTYRGDAPPDAWLRRVAANACTRMRRGKKNDRSTHFQIRDDDLKEDPGARIDALIEMRMRGLKEGLASLALEDRRALFLHEGDGLSIAEVSEAIGLSESAVKSRLFRARKKILESMQRI